MPGRTRKIALTEGVVAGILFGTGSIFTRFLGDTDAFFIVFWRLMIACVTLAVLLIICEKAFNPSLMRKNMKNLLPLGFLLALHFILFTAAVKDTTIMNATVLVSTVPIFSIIISSFLKLKPSRHALLGLAISFMGVSIIAYTESVTANVSVSQTVYSVRIKGDLEAVLAAFVLSLYLSYGRTVRNKMSLTSIMLPIYMFASIVTGAVSMFEGGRILSMSMTVQNVVSLVGIGVFPTAIAHTLSFSSLSNLKSFETATMSLIEPVGATLLGIVLFQEVPVPLFSVGAVLTLLGIVFVMKNGN
jgi:drug/metabolite transporter (DMT)-like permease